MTAVPNTWGVSLSASPNTVGGFTPGAGNLISGNTENGINLFGEFASGNLIQGNYIGTNAAGTAALANGSLGVSIVFASSNTVGGTAAGAGNVISGNAFTGVFLLGPDTEENVILGNFIGTDPTGTAAIGNGDAGVAIHTATNNTIGGTEAGSGNVISGNHNGVMFGDLDAANNRVQGNYIGTNSTGTGALPNADMGLLIWGVDNIIGGSENGAGNVISGNTTNGISLAQGSSGTVIEGNLIGLDATGTAAIANNIGIFVESSPDNVIGGSSAGARNIISGNTDTNVYVVAAEAAENVVQGNYVGTDITGTVSLEGGRGIQLIDAPNNTIGGTGSGAGNLISGNANGIRIEGPTASGNVIQGNRLGTDATGTLPLGNRGATIRLTNGASDNTIGGMGPGAGNVIANGTWMGVVLFADAGTGNRIQSNSIFDNSALGIELGRNGVTPNDEGDPDTGPNNSQNFPVLTPVASNGGAVVEATLNSTSNSSFTLDFFSNTDCDPTGYGEGKTPLGTASLTTDASGNGTATASFSTITGTILTATATDAEGSTSEYSKCAELTTLGVTPSPTTRSVTPGESATYTIAVAAQGGAFEKTVGLSCSGNPSGTTCSFANPELTLADGQASTTMTVTTVAPSAFGPMTPGPAPSNPLPKIWNVLLVLAGFGLVGVGVGHRERKYALASAAALLLILQASCGKDGNSPPTGGTTPGTYELTVTVAWEGAQSTATATLVVD
jgi:titin